MKTKRAGFFICILFVQVFSTEKSAFTQRLGTSPQQLFIQKLSDELSAYFEINKSFPDIELVPLRVPAQNVLRINNIVIQIDAELPHLLNQQFGDRDTLVLAYILAHELAHYFYHLPEEKDSRKKTNNELDADQKGFWVAHLARYYFDEQLFVDLLQWIYSHYRLDLAHYPDLSKRLATIRGIMQNTALYQLAEVYKASSFFYALEAYQLAADCIRFIRSKGCRNEMILNNLGLAYLREIMVNPALKDSIFTLPLEFESNSFIRGESEKSIEKLMAEAEDAFREAMRMNPSYENPRCNLAILYLLQKRYASAIEEIDFFAAFSARLSPASLLVKAIAFAYLDQRIKAEYFFSKSCESSSLLANYNYALFKEILGSQASFVRAVEHLDTNTLQNLKAKIKQKLFDFSKMKINPEINEWTNFKRQTAFQSEKVEMNFQAINYITLSDGNTKPNLHLGFYKEEKLAFMYWKAVYGSRRPTRIALFSSLPTYKGSSSLGIRLGDESQKVLEKYGHPDLIADNFYLYRQAKIMFEINQNQVTGWTVFELF